VRVSHGAGSGSGSGRTRTITLASPIDQNGGAASAATGIGPAQQSFRVPARKQWRLLLVGTKSSEQVT
jgi:hypothetical protein